MAFTKEAMPFTKEDFGDGALTFERAEGGCWSVIFPEVLTSRDFGGILEFFDAVRHGTMGEALKAELKTTMGADDGWIDPGDLRDLTNQARFCRALC